MKRLSLTSSALPCPALNCATVMALLCAACGAPMVQDANALDATADSPPEAAVSPGSLVGTWEAVYMGGMDFDTVRIRYVLSGAETGGTMHEEVDGQNAAARGGCHYLGIADGTWQYGARTLQLRPATGTEQIDGCADPSHNVPVAPSIGSFYLSIYGSVDWRSPDSFVMNGAPYNRL